MHILTAVLTFTMMQQGPLAQASRLDLEGKTKEARTVIQSVIDTATAPLAKAQAQRAMAMSYAFDADCKKTVEWEEKVIDYWKTREQAEPQNAFYQQGEMANEAARVCIDAGDIKTAEKYYRLGTELGMKEPEPKTHPASLWNYRLAHALARVAARKGDKSAAMAQVTVARNALDSDTAMARNQERFYPYLVGYVALYLGDLQTAQKELTAATTARGNERDPFMKYLLAMTHEKMGHNDVAAGIYKEAYDLATAHNPPAAFVRREAGKKLQK